MSIYDDKSDEELIGALRDGDDAITEYLMEKYKNLVKSKAGTMYIIGADKDDLIQEGMIGLFKAITGYDPGRDASFYTFADLCVSRQMYKAVDAGKRKKHTPLNTYISLYESNYSDDNSSKDTEMIEALETLRLLTDNNPEAMLIDKENTKALEAKIMESLSDFEQQVLSLHMTGIGYAEVARILGKESKSVDNALSRIKSKVKKILSER